MKLYYSGRELRSKKEYPIWGIVLISVLIYLSPFVSSMSSYFAFAICLFRIVRYDAKVFATDYCLLLPLTNLFRSSGGMAFMVYLCLFAAVYYFICTGMRINAAYVVLIVLMNYLFLRMQMNISKFLLCFGQLALLCVLLPEQDERSAARTTKYFCISLIMSSLYALIFRNTWQLQAVRGSEDQAIWGTGIMRFQGLFRDPNYYMTMLIIGITLLAKQKDMNGIRTASFLLQGVCMVFLGAMTYSKTFFLVFVLFGIAYIVWRFRTKRYFWGVCLTIAVILSGGYLLSSDNSPFAVVLDRFGNLNNMGDVTTGRMGVYKAYWDVITQDFSTFLFGLGMKADGLYKDPHNLPLEILYYVGMIGFILFISFFIAMMRVMLKKTHGCSQGGFVGRYIVILMTAVLYVALHGMYEIVFYGGMFLSLLSLLMSEKTVEVYKIRKG